MLNAVLMSRVRNEVNLTQAAHGVRHEKRHQYEFRSGIVRIF